MYGLLMGLWKIVFQKVQYQALILGLDHAGKSTLLEQMRSMYSGTRPPNTMKIPPTVGLNIGKFDVDKATMVFWDLGGQVSLRVLWDKYFSDAHAVVYVIDAADGKRLEESRKEIEKLLVDPDLLDAPLLIMANKQDLKEALAADEIKKTMNLQVGKRPMLVQPISALNGRGVQEGLNWLLSVLPHSPRTARLDADRT